MKLFDTATKSCVQFKPTSPVRMYVCGITPDGPPHLGHALTFLTYDLLQRRLEDMGHQVRLVRNITDVDDPIYVKAAELGIDYRELAKRETAEFKRLMKLLNLRPPAAEPLASEYIDEMARAVGQLLETGHAYRQEGDVYFDVKSFPDFGKLAGYPRHIMLQYMADRGGDPDRPGKRNPFDFLLWKAVTDPADPAAWPSAVGYGRPGWHIECSVMAAAILGAPIDIHGGGMDLIFPHHECELAQTAALGQQPLSKLWMHTAPMLQAGEKMSKSLGNLVFVRDLLDQAEPAALRLALMSYHYRRGGEWCADFLSEATQLLAEIKQALGRSSGPDPRPYAAKIRAALDDDLNVPVALQTLR
ncbi:MAG TPA: cysteine--tRNA ligase [Candidatus Saccharimonadales bacterium]|nr:cysteine--tRNA ligase [Candidatus Saccharimonadales bacterium]